MPVVVKKENCSSQFLDGGQYSRNGILRYERIFGKTFVSTGGVETTKAFCADLNLSPGMNVLDVGCGTGGSAFFLARKFKVNVVGVDLSSNMLAIAEEHKATMEPEVRDRVTFHKMDATKATFEDGSFDLLYSRDAIMHIADKPLLYRNVHKWLKPGGQVLVSEYIHGKNHPNHTEEYLEYIVDRGYQLLSLSNYEECLKKSGFTNIRAVDKTNEFIEILEKEMVKFRAAKEDFVQDFSLKDFRDLEEGWEIKVERCTQGEQGWALFKAYKN